VACRRSRSSGYRLNDFLAAGITHAWSRRIKRRTKKGKRCLAKRFLSAPFLFVLVLAAASPAQSEMLRVGRLSCSTRPRIGIVVGSTQFTALHIIQGARLGAVSTQAIQSYGF
jgi:hypothetical protein